MSYGLDDLLYLMARLRDPDTGCPWDIAQRFETIVPSTIEEAYEVADAIEKADYAHLREELGDLLFQVIFYAQLGREQSLFDFEAIVHTLVDKLVRRHPHVFIDGDLRRTRAAARLTEADVKQQWEAIKADERAEKGAPGLLDAVPAGLPALTRAQTLQKRAASVGFDFQTAAKALEKVREELAEVEAELVAGHSQSQAFTAELGDLLFAVVNVCRLAGGDAEATLRATNRKFERRFAQMHGLLEAAGLALDSADLAQMEAAWVAAKATERQPS